MVLWDVACLQIKIKADHIFLWMWLRGSNVILKKDDSWREKEEKKKKSPVWCKLSVGVDEHSYILQL